MGEIDVCFCHIPKILTLGSTHLSKINREAGCKNQPLETYLAKNTLVGVVGIVGVVGTIPRTPIQLMNISNSVISRAC